MPTTGNTHKTSKRAGSNVDDTILNLNKELGDAISAFVPKSVKIRFDLPDEDHTSNPTVSIFLYDIQENLEIRSGLVPTFDPRVTSLKGNSKHPISMPVTNVTCRYLFTYWQQKASIEPTGQYAGPANQSITTMNQILNAILTHRHFTTLEVAQSRVIPPMDLQSLGTFWQALESRPRLCLGYEITVPIRCNLNTIYTAVSSVKLNEIDLIGKQR